MCSSDLYIAHCAATGLAPGPAAVRASDIELTCASESTPDSAGDSVAMTIMAQTANQLADTAADGDGPESESLRWAPVWRGAVRNVIARVKNGDLVGSQIRPAAQALAESVKPGGLAFDADGSFRASGVTASQLAAVLIRGACAPHINDCVVEFPIEHVVEVAIAIAQFAFPPQLRLPPIVV